MRECGLLRGVKGHGLLQAVSHGNAGLVSEGGLRNSQIGFGLQPSFSAKSIFPLRVPIDHLLHSEDIRVRDRRLGPAMGSDHFPLVVDLQYAPGP